MDKQAELVNKIWYILFLLLLLLSGCANQQPPSGGGLDTVPPKIIETYPPDGTLNYDKKYIEFEFSEYVDKRAFQDAIFISPMSNGGLEFDWSGKGVRVYLPEVVIGKTYTITVGTDVVDLNNGNRMASAYTTRFSTGGRIDNGVITGKIYNAKPSGIFVFAYILDSLPLALKDRRPDYISQVGADGRYKLAGLAEGTYRVFAVKDEFKDMLFQSEQDQIGIPAKDCPISIQDSLIENINFILQQTDTLKPRLLSAKFTDQNHVLLSFSESINLSPKLKRNIFLYDSLLNASYFPEAFFKGKSREKEYFISFRDSVIESNKLTLHISSFSDLNGNVNDSDAVPVYYTARADTVAMGVFQTDPPQNSKDIRPDLQGVKILFDDYPSVSSGTIAFKDSAKRAVSFHRRNIDDASFLLQLDSSLQPGMEYIISTNLKNWVDYSGKSFDSIFTVRFSVLSDIEFTGLYGKLAGIKKPSGYLELISADDETQKYSTTIGSDSTFGFTAIKPGKYKLFFFYDTNGDKKWSSGSLLPFAFSEECIYFKDVISLPARWAVTDLQFDVSGVEGD